MNQERGIEQVEGMDMGDLLHAGDIAVVASSMAVATKVLRIIELNVVHYGAKLNRSELRRLSWARTTNIRFDDGTDLA